MPTLTVSAARQARLPASMAAHMVIESRYFFIGIFGLIFLIYRDFQLWN
jgi:hypothetical protein